MKTQSQILPMQKPLGYIAYEGKSKIDGRPIVIIINKINTASDNAKTGELVQSFIIRADVDPVTAQTNGQDVSICGQCEHRPSLARESGEAPCYVNTGRSVLQVYNAYKRGRYTKAAPETIARALTGKSLRLGTYGDPAAAPVKLWQQLTKYTAGHVGYSHQWQNPRFDFDQWRGLVMASADSADDAALANLHGLRVFRVTTADDKQAGEISCPASAEGGRRTTCADCMLCAGTSKAARDIVIRDHARGHARRFIPITTA